MLTVNLFLLFTIILGVPPCSSTVALHLEVGLISIKAQAKVLMLKYWLKLIFFIRRLGPTDPTRFLSVGVKEAYI